jgi:hypothetical protein
MAYSKRHFAEHKAEKLAYSHKYYQDNIGDYHRKAKIYRETHKSQRREYDVKYYQSHKLSESQRGKEYRLNHKKETSARIKKYVRQLANEVLTHYGDGKLACVRCGYAGEIAALSLDHMNGGGRKHRASLDTTKWYHWLKEHDYPLGFQTLCNNCQFIKRAENKEYAKQPKSPRADYSKGYRQSYKKDVLTHYGNGELACVKCGFDDIRALSIDHINGGGSKHRASINHTNIYRWLAKNNYPEGYQTLCMRCQWIKRGENNELMKEPDKVKGKIAEFVKAS